MSHLDFNNQYGWALSQLLPYGGFEDVEDVSMYTSMCIHDYYKL